SLDRITMIHSGYEFADFEKALQEAARTLNPNGGIGGLITNGAGDKSVLKRKLDDTGRLLQEAYSDQVVYETPNTVSSKLTLLEARSRLRQYFNKVILFTYHDRMKIDEGYRSYVYYHGFDTYRYYFEPPIHNYEDWAEARDEAYSEEYQVDPSGKKILYDTIDTGWILFSDPK
ncbi:MAG TPA: hypothetical protein VHD84_01305, partial [Candidatus Saccharimonadales bacterium]|nr:hypothetical protein [Candidatus Saccharimonadales bacterium]